MTYDANRAAQVHRPVELVKLYLDSCDLTYGVSPCLATGSAGQECYNTLRSCQYRSAYVSTTGVVYTFSPHKQPLPFNEGERPYLESINWLPTEIKDNQTTTPRHTITLHDPDYDNDVGIDPYVANRSATQGSFFSKLFARNTNWQNRIVEIYEGYYGDAIGEYKKRFRGKLQAVRLGRGTVSLTVIDLLRNLNDILVPPKVDVRLLVACDAVATELAVSDVSQLYAAPGVVRIDDEYISYASVYTAGNLLQGCVRGVDNTVAVAHNVDNKVQPVRVYTEASPFDTLLQDMLYTDAGYSASDVNAQSFTEARDADVANDINVLAKVSEPTKLRTLVFELTEMLDCKLWTDENGLITVGRNLPNDPSRAYETLTDAANIVMGSATVDLNDDSRITRALLYWEKDAIGDLDDIASYARLDAAADQDAELPAEYDGKKELVMWSRWHQPQVATEEQLRAWVETMLKRRVWRQRDAQPLVSIQVSGKDTHILTGAFVRLTTRQLAHIDGTAYQEAAYQVVRRALTAQGAELRCIRMQLDRVVYFAPDTAAATFAAASADDKEYWYFCDDSGLMPDGTRGYVFI